MGTNDPGSDLGRESASDLTFQGTLPADLARALRWLRAHLSEPIELERLAQIAGVRPRTLEDHFKQFLATTPLGWVRRTRLANARQALLRQSEPLRSVADVALANGFTHLGRFAGEYRKVFGEPPSATRGRVRREGAQGPREDLDEAVRLTFEALPLAFAVAPPECNSALEQLESPQELAPSYGLPKAVASWCWSQRVAHGFSINTEHDRARAYQLAEEACRVADNDALTLTLSSGTLVLLHRLDEADRLLERALALDPWLAYGWIRRGWMSAYLGDNESAIRELRTALHLMPFEPLRHIIFIGMGCAHFHAERHERAVRWVQSGLQACPGSFWAERVAVAAVALTGARAEARRMARQLMRKDPDLTVSAARRAWPFKPAFMSRLARGLELAEVPRA